MPSRNLVSLALRLVLVMLLAAHGMGGCKKDGDTIIITIVGSLTIRADGGAGYASDGSTNGVGGNGGLIDALSITNLLIGTEPAPAYPALPAAPTTGTSLTSINGVDPMLSGNILIDTAITTTGGGNVTVTSTNGDIVVSGSIIGEELGAARPTITLNAPNGTVYVSGAILNSGADGADTGDAGNSVTITARRIVITGTIDTSGENNAAGSGGGAGLIDLDTSAGGDALYLMGTLITRGGSGNLNGAPGADVDIFSFGPVWLFGSVDARGGSTNGASAGPVAGNGGEVVIDAAGTVTVNAAIDMRGGDAITTGAGATAGDGGYVDFVMSIGAGGVYFFGSVDGRGGAAVAGSLGTGISGGDGDGVGISGVFEFFVAGLGSFSSRGGDGGATGGAGGTVNYLVESGLADVASSYDLRGGAGAGTNGTGGAGGSYTLDLLGIFGLPFQARHTGSVNADGGSGRGTGNGGPGGTVLVQASADNVVAGSVSASGGRCEDGLGGAGGNIDILCSSTFYGDVVVEGAVAANGGPATGAAAGTGGAGGTVDLVTDGFPGAVISRGAIGLSGGSALLNGGSGGTLTMSNSSGAISLGGSVTASGGAASAGGAGGAVNITVGASSPRFESSATVTLDGGASSTGANGGNGGSLTVTCANAGADVVLYAAFSMAARGGSAAGTFVGGAGGALTLTSTNGEISIAGSMTLTGGAAAAGTGGLGGTLAATSGTAAITIETGATINVSGGDGLTGGAAVNDNVAGATAPAAVVLDADSANGAPPTGGAIVNNGTITANAGAGGNVNGGDVVFDGSDAAGTGAPAAGTQSRTASGSGLAGDFGTP